MWLVHRVFDVAHWFIVWCGCFVVGVLRWLTGSLCGVVASLSVCLTWLTGSLCGVVASLLVCLT